MEPVVSFVAMALVVGGLIGLALVRFALDWAIVIISVLGGASLVMMGLRDLLNRDQGTLIVIAGLAVAVAGFIVQTRVIQAESKPAA